MKWLFGGRQKGGGPELDGIEGEMVGDIRGFLEGDKVREAGEALLKRSKLQSLDIKAKKKARDDAMTALAVAHSISGDDAQREIETLVETQLSSTDPEGRLAKKNFQRMTRDLTVNRDHDSTRVAQQRSLMVRTLKTAYLGKA